MFHSDVFEPIDMLPAIVGLSAHVDDFIVEKTKQVGMICCLEAPLHSETIVNYILKVLAKRNLRINRLQMINYKLSKTRRTEMLNQS